MMSLAITNAHSNDTSSVNRSRFSELANNEINIHLKFEYNLGFSATKC